MDFNLLKTITPLPFRNKPHQRGFILPKYPHIDYVNPGVGGVAKIFDFYVPIYAKSLPYAIEKKDENDYESVQNAEAQKGKGNSDDINDIEMSENDLNKKEVEKEIVQKSNKRLHDGVLEAFMHPKIKTAKIILPSKTNVQETHKKNINKSPKVLKHSSNVV